MTLAEITRSDQFLRFLAGTKRPVADIETDMRLQPGQSCTSALEVTRFHCFMVAIQVSQFYEAGAKRTLGEKPQRELIQPCMPLKAFNAEGLRAAVRQIHPHVLSSNAILLGANPTGNNQIFVVDST